MSKYADFMKYVEAAINKDIYLWGGGQPELWTLSQLTEARIKAKETSTNNVNRVKKLWNERKGKYPNAYAADCSGGIVYCMMLAGIVSKSFDDTANGLLNACKKLSNRAELRVGDWVGQRSGTNTFHIGVVFKIENGQIWIAEWRGRDRGCVLTRIEDGASTWNRYGRPDKFYVADGQSETPGEVTPPPVPAPNFEVARLLKVTSPYMRGNDVHNVQVALTNKGFLPGSTGNDGIYGPATKSAVINFQMSAGLKADGVVGEATVKALGGKWDSNVDTFAVSRLLKLKSPIMHGSDVEAVQRALLRRNYSVGSMGVDGEYGSRTKQAVINFQKAVGLAADGIVGEKTCQALNGIWRG